VASNRRSISNNVAVGSPALARTPTPKALPSENQARDHQLKDCRSTNSRTVRLTSSVAGSRSFDATSPTTRAMYETVP
jgi:hypothetical protein